MSFKPAGVTVTTQLVLALLLFLAFLAALTAIAEYASNNHPATPQGAAEAPHEAAEAPDDSELPYAEQEIDGFGYRTLRRLAVEDSRVAEDVKQAMLDHKITHNEYNQILGDSNDRYDAAQGGITAAKQELLDVLVD